MPHLPQCCQNRIRQRTKINSKNQRSQIQNQAAQRTITMRNNQQHPFVTLNNKHVQSRELNEIMKDDSQMECIALVSK